MKTQSSDALLYSQARFSDSVSCLAGYTPRGVVASLIASAQVMEMRCGYKNQITAALAKAKRLGVPFDINEKQDYSAVVFLASQILTRLGKDGVGPWCKDKAPNVVKFLQEP